MFSFDRDFHVWAVVAGGGPGKVKIYLHPPLPGENGGRNEEKLHLRDAFLFLRCFGGIKKEKKCHKFIQYPSSRNEDDDGWDNFSMQVEYF